MEKKVDLATAKGKLESDTIYLGQNNTLMIADFGKYRPNITFIVPDKWTLDSNGKIESPIRFISEARLTDNMNIDFNASKEEVLFGETWKSKNGKQMFKITPPNKAKSVLIRANWGGAFANSRGQTSEYAKNIEVDYFRIASSNGGGAGYDYYIVPVDFIAKRDLENEGQNHLKEHADVKDLLQELTDKENERVLNNEKKYQEKIEEANRSREGKEKYLPLIKKAVDELNEIEQKYNYAQTEYVYGEYYINEGRYTQKPYNEETLNKVNADLENYREAEKNRETYLPKFEELNPLVESVGLSLKFELFAVHIENVGYKYDEQGWISCANRIDSIIKEHEEEKRKAEELVRINTMKLKKEAEEKIAKAKGYPSDFSYYNRVTGATGQSHAYVIRPDGTIRENDSLDYSNPNHAYKYSDPIHNAEGTQHWKQIMPGEIIIAYTKDYTAAPLIPTIEWMPEQVTPAQLDAIQDIIHELEEKYCIQVGIKGWDELLKTTPPSDLNVDNLLSNTTNAERGNNNMKEKIIKLSDIALKIGNKPQEVRLPNGVTRMSINWDAKTAQDAVKEVIPLASSNQKIVFDGPAPAWFVSSLTHAVHPMPVGLNDPKIGIVDIPPLPIGQPNPECGVEFAITEGETCVRIDWQLTDPIFDVDNLSKIVLPEIPAGKEVVIGGGTDILPNSGKGPNYIATAIGEAYAHTNKAVSYYQPQTQGYTVGITHFKGRKIGEVIPKTEIEKDIQIHTLGKTKELLQKQKSATDEIDVIVGKNGQIQQNISTHEKQVKETNQISHCTISTEIKVNKYKKYDDPLL